jgi:hypothetical protein
MAYLDTTRTGTVYFEFQINWMLTVYPSNLVPFTPLHVGVVNGNVGGHGGFSGSWEIYWTSTPGPGTWSYQVQVLLTADDGHGTPVNATATIASGTRAGSIEWVDLTGTLSGVFSASVGTDILWDITSGSSINSTTGELTHPPITTYDWHEKSRVGSTASASLTMGGASAVSNTVVTSGNRVRMNYIIGTYLLAEAEDGGSTECTITQHQCNGKDPHQDTHTHSFGGNTASNWYVNASAAVGSTYEYVLLNSLGRLPALVEMNVVTRAWKDAYPDELTYLLYGFDYELIPFPYRTVNATGNFSEHDNIWYYYIYSEIYNNTTADTKTTELDNIPPTISTQIDPLSLAPIHDSGTDTRIMFRSWEFNGANIQLTNPYSIGGIGNIRTYSPLQGMSSYRWLKVQIKCISGTNQAGQIQITDFHGYTKRWNVVAATVAYEVVTLDLCMPDEWSVGGLPDYDDKNTPYPRKNTASADFAGSESVDSAYWGVTSASQLRVITGNIDIGTTELDKVTHAHQNFIPSGKDWRTERTTPDIVATSPNLTTTYYYARRFWQLEQDGRTEEESDVHFQNTVTPVVSTWVAQSLSIKQLCDQILATDDSVIRHPGFNATNSVAYPGTGTCSVTQPPLFHCYLNGETGLATWLHGGGALTKSSNAGTGHNWEYGFDHNGGSIKAQALFDAINGDFIPDIDDPFNIHKATGTATLFLHGASFLRAPAHGITYDNNGDIATTGTVSVVRTLDSLSGGSDSSFTAEGVYETGTPYALGSEDHTVQYYTFTVSWTPAYTALRQRVVYRWAQEGGNDLSADVHGSLLKFYADIIDGNIHLHMSYTFNNSSFGNKDTGIACDGGFEVRWTITREEKRLDLVYANAGTTYSTYSVDEGEAFAVATTIMTGTKPTACVADSGIEYIFARNATNGIDCVVRDARATVISAAHTVVASGVADDSLAAFVRDTTIYLFYRNTSNNVIVVTSTDNGLTFA